MTVYDICVRKKCKKFVPCGPCYLTPVPVPECKMSRPTCKTIEQEYQRRIWSSTIHPDGSSEHQQDQQGHDHLPAGMSAEKHGNGRTVILVEREREKGCSYNKCLQGACSLKHNKASTGEPRLLQQNEWKIQQMMTRYKELIFWFSLKGMSGQIRSARKQYHCKGICYKIVILIRG